MLEVEGGDRECVHAHPAPRGRPRDRQRLPARTAARRGELFGAPATPYPEYYTPKPYSKSFVHHLDHWYAQSHPDEDFAETFAVWLDPESMWAHALRRLAGASGSSSTWTRLMRELRGQRPRVDLEARSRSAVAS